MIGCLKYTYHAVDSDYWFGVAWNFFLILACIAYCTRFSVIDSFFCLFLSRFVGLLYSWSYLLSEVEWERTCLTAFYQCVLWVQHPSSNQCPDSSQILLWRLSLLLGNNLNLECFSFTVKRQIGIVWALHALPHQLVWFTSNLPSALHYQEKCWHINILYPCNFVASFIIQYVW